MVTSCVPHPLLPLSLPYAGGLLQAAPLWDPCAGRQEGGLSEQVPGAALGWQTGESVRCALLEGCVEPLTGRGPAGGTRRARGLPVVEALLCGALCFPRVGLGLRVRMVWYRCVVREPVVCQCVVCLWCGVRVTCVRCVWYAWICGGRRSACVVCLWGGCVCLCKHVCTRVMFLAL